jgi:hypothetical protein
VYVIDRLGAAGTGVTVNGLRVVKFRVIRTVTTGAGPLASGSA